MAVTRFPDTTDAAISEANWTDANKGCVNPTRISGFDLSINAGLNLDVAAGVAIVDGLRVEVTTTTTVTLTDNATNYVWIQADGTIYDNTSTTPTAATDLLFGQVTTASGNITEIEPSEELDDNTGVPVSTGRVRFFGITQLGASSGLTAVSSEALGAGLWLIDVRLHYNCPTSSGSSTTQTLTLASATESDTEVVNGAFISTGQSFAYWATTGSPATAFGVETFGFIKGFVGLPDGATVNVNVSTGSATTLDGGYWTATKIV